MIKRAACLLGQSRAAGPPPDPDIRRWIRPFERAHPAASGAFPVVADLAARVPKAKSLYYLSPLSICRALEASRVGSGGSGIRTPGPAPRVHGGARAGPSAPPAAHCQQLFACICTASYAAARRHAAVARGWWPDPAGPHRAPFCEAPPGALLSGCVWQPVISMVFICVQNRRGRMALAQLGQRGKSSS